MPTQLAKSSVYPIPPQYKDPKHTQLAQAPVQIPKQTPYLFLLITILLLVILIALVIALLRLLRDKMHNHCAIFAPNGTYRAI